MKLLDPVNKIYVAIRSDPYRREFFSTLSGAFIFFALVSWSIESATSLHWSLGVLLTVVSGAVTMWVAKQTLHQHHISLFVILFITLVFLGAIVLSGVSYIIHTQGWAYYDAPQEVTIETFRNYYLWTFVDMVPAIDIWKTFPVKSPVEPTDAITGAPVLVFRIFVLGFVFESLRQWWKSHAVDRSERPNGQQQNASEE